MVLYKNGLILQNGKFENKEMLIDYGRIIAIDQKIDCKAITIDLKGKRIVPALIDIHTHGANGSDFNLATLDEMHQIMDFYISQNVGTVYPTVLTDSDEVLKRQLSLIASLSDSYPQIKGIHLEGPFLNKAYKGAMPESFLQSPSLEKFLEYQQYANGLIKIITISPELDGAIDLTKAVSNLGVVVSLGHSGADYDITMKCIEAGAKSFTHTFNAMASLHQHQPNIIGAALVSDNYCEVICDGFHLHPQIVKLIVKTKGFDKVIAVTDSIMAAGLPDGNYKLGVNNVTVVNGDAKITETSFRAGSTLTAMKALENFMAFTQLPLEVAIKTMSENPAKLMNIYQNTGSLEVGKLAEFFIID